MIVLAAGDATAVLHPDDGGRLGQLTVGGRSFLRDHDPGRDRAWAYWGSYPLIPWSNRIVDARFRFAGRTWELPDRWIDGTAIHGLACRRAGDVTAQSATSATLAIELDDTPPWTLSCTQRFALSAGRLDQDIAVVNNGADDVPVGLGIHPWFVAGPVQVPADLAWPDVDCIPTGEPRPVSDDQDLRHPTTPPLMDTCFTGLTGRAARVGDLTLEWSDAAAHVVVYTGDPGWVALEPVTNANDGFNLFDRGVEGTGVIVVPPGGSASMRYTFGWTT
jgi:aldose 1-epimerase